VEKKIEENNEIVVIKERRKFRIDLQLFFLGIIALTCIGFILDTAKFVLMPLTLAIFLAFILMPIIDFLRRYWFPRILAIFVSLGTAALVMIFIGLIAYQGTKDFRNKIPAYESKFWHVTESVIKQSEVLPIDLKNLNWREQINVNAVSGLVFSSLGNFMTFLTYTLITFIFLLFILLEKNRFPDKILKAFGESMGETVLGASLTIKEKVQTYVFFKTGISVITGFLVWVLLKYYLIDFALLWALTAFLLNFIPNIGSTVAGIPPLLIAFIQYGSLAITLKVFLGFTIIQIVIGQIIDPGLLGEGLNISPIVVLGSLVFWGWLWGPLGMLICIPIAAAVKIFCEEIPSLAWIAPLISNRVEK